jgi:hypothetical protein
VSGTPLENLLYPRHCRVSVSADKKQLAFTFSFMDQPSINIALPVEGAAGLQRNLAQCLFLLGVKAAPRPGPASQGPASQGQASPDPASPDQPAPDQPAAESGPAADQP